MLQAAEQDLGLALAREVLAADALRAGRLWRLSPIALEGRLLSPREALELDLVHEVVPEAQLLGRALEKAAALAELPLAGFAQVKAALRTPTANAVRAAGDADARRWTATWFTDDAQARIGAAVSKLKKK